MWGSATLAIVVSSTCRSTAIMMATVRMPCSSASSFSVGTWCGCAAAVAMALAGGGPLRRPDSERPLLRIDRHVDRKAGEQRPSRLAVDRDAHRHALSHLHPIAVGVLRGQQREFRAGAASDRGDMAAQLARIGVDLDLGRLAGGHVLE